MEWTHRIWKQTFQQFQIGPLHSWQFDLKMPKKMDINRKSTINRRGHFQDPNLPWLNLNDKKKQHPGFRQSVRKRVIHHSQVLYVCYIMLFIVFAYRKVHLLHVDYFYTFWNILCITLGSVFLNTFSSALFDKNQQNSPQKNPFRQCKTTVLQGSLHTKSTASSMLPALPEHSLASKWVTGRLYGSNATKIQEWWSSMGGCILQLF